MRLLLVGRAPGCSNTCGAITLSNYILLQFFTNVYKYDKIVTVNYGTVEVDVDKLKELRINAGFSQRELATRAGLTPGAVWQVEQRGSGSPATLKKIADVLGVRPVDLLKKGR
jgi:DNA-binding XRE family transcriptional regulator